MGKQDLTIIVMLFLQLDNYTVIVYVHARESPELISSVHAQAKNSMTKYNVKDKVIETAVYRYA